MKKLILFPYAGSLGMAYVKWVKKLKEKYEVYRIDYNRLKENVNYYEAGSWSELVTLLMEQMKHIVTDEQYILFGHSMGSRVNAALYYEMEKAGLPLPEQIVFSGCEILSKRTESPDAFTNEQFWKKYVALGGIGPEVLENKELSELTFEMLRKDVFLLSQFDYNNYKTKILCPVSILNGRRDTINTKEEWESLLGRKIEYLIYNGGHFFIYDQEAEIVEYLLKL